MGSFYPTDICIGQRNARARAREREKEARYSLFYQRTTVVERIEEGREEKISVRYTLLRIYIYSLLLLLVVRRTTADLIGSSS